jgi:hypothetical protein
VATQDEGLGATKEIIDHNYLRIYTHIIFYDQSIALKYITLNTKEPKN